jgi:hypothetical protein
MTRYFETKAMWRFTLVNENIKPECPSAGAAAPTAPGAMKHRIVGERDTLSVEGFLV